MSIFNRGKNHANNAPEFNHADATDEATLADKVADESVEPQMPDLTQKKKSNTGTVVKFMLILGGLVVLFSLFVAFKGGDKVTAPETMQVAPQERIGVRHSRTFDLSLPQPEPQAEPEPAFVEVEPDPVEQAWREQNQQVVVVNNEYYQPEETPADRRLSGSVTIDVGSSNRSSPPSDEFYPNETPHQTPLNNRLQPTITASTRANKRADLTYLLKKGTNIGCTLDTRIVTTHPGITRCLVTKDVYSANGKVLLIERGSEIIGEQTTSMLQGQAKVFVLWNTIDTPSGITLDIASPSADSLGASGQDAQVDTHFWKRFGGAILLSIIDDGLEMIGDAIKRNNDRIVYDSSSNNIENMATEALRNSINIPPTGYVNQGTLLNVMVARDVDFRGVYELVTPRLY